jgi:hypothetical protein
MNCQVLMAGHADRQFAGELPDDGDVCECWFSATPKTARGMRAIDTASSVSFNYLQASC